jgi:hypothetical protein
MAFTESMTDADSMSSAVQLLADFSNCGSAHMAGVRILTPANRSRRH